MKRTARVVAIALFAIAALPAKPQSLSTMPDYKPRQQLSGTIRIRGDYHQRAMLKNWETGFREYQPNIVFDDELTSTIHGIPALVFGLADLALLGREIAPLENLSFRRMFKYDPTEIVTATGSYDTPYQTFALGIFVNRTNPLTRLSFSEAAGIFGCGAGRNIRTWGQLGLAGEWANKPIHVLGYPSANNIANFFELKVLQSPPSAGPTLPHGVHWNCDLKEYSNDYDKNDKPTVSSDAYMMKDLGDDAYAIAYSGIAEQTPKVKPLALAAKDSGPYVQLTPQTVADRTYPLARSMYIYLNRAPGRSLEPKVAEFVGYILSRQGQQAVTRQHVFLPLTATAIAEQRIKLE